AREAGREAYIAELEALAGQLGVADAVLFTPPTSRIATAYAASDLVLQLSRKPEAFGRTVVEAPSVGRPVLGWAPAGVGALLPGRCRLSTPMRWPPRPRACCAIRRRRSPFRSRCRPCSRPPWTCMPSWPAEHAPAAGRAFAWTPAWVVLAVALWPLPGPAEAVFSLGALVVAGQLAWVAARGRPMPLDRGAFVLAGLLFGAYWLPELLSAPDALDRGRAWKETLADLRYLPLLWGIAIAVREPRGRRVVAGGIAVLALAWSIDAPVQALAGASPLFRGLDALKGLSGGGPLCPVDEVQAWDRVSGVFGDCNPKLGLVLASLSPFALAWAER